MKNINFILILIGISFILSNPINKISEIKNLKNITIPKIEVKNPLNVSEVEKIERNLRNTKGRRLDFFSFLKNLAHDLYKDPKNLVESFGNKISTYIVNPVKIASNTVKNVFENDVTPSINTAFNFAKFEITKGVKEIGNKIEEKKEEISNVIRYKFG